jgi:hypothetical protein
VLNDLHIDAIAVPYNAAAWDQRFLAMWPQGSDAHTSYWRRIQQGPRHPNVQAELGQTQVTGVPLRQAQGERWGM